MSQTAQSQEEMRFHLDESVDHAIARGLIQRGIDATTSTDAGLIGAVDEVQFTHCKSTNRVLVTHDHGFLRLAALDATHAGVAYCPPGRRSIGQIVHSLVQLWRTTTPDAMSGIVHYL